jgi:hypothetical protein
MARIGDTQPHRGIEFGVHDEGNDVWAWAYYPKIGKGVSTRGQVKGNLGRRNCSLQSRDR